MRVSKFLMDINFPYVEYIAKATTVREEKIQLEQVIPSEYVEKKIAGSELVDDVSFSSFSYISYY